VCCWLFPWKCFLISESGCLIATTHELMSSCFLLCQRSGTRTSTPTRAPALEMLARDTHGDPWVTEWTPIYELAKPMLRVIHG
jgi:hypothetical protein